MGGWGGQNPWPFQWGGGTSPVEDAYNALRKNRGIGGVGPQGGIEDAYVWEEAAAIASSDVAMERAALQAFPFASTDHLSVWETRFGLPPAGTEQERRECVAAFDAAVADGSIPAISAALAVLSPYLSLEIPTSAQLTYTMLGKMYAPRVGGWPAYGRGASDFTNYSDAYVMHVAFDTVGAGGVLPDNSIIGAVTALLSEALPAWQDFEIHQLGGGFFFDGGTDGLSLFDWAAFGVP